MNKLGKRLFRTYTPGVSIYYVQNFVDQNGVGFYSKNRDLFKHFSDSIPINQAKTFLSLDKLESFSEKGLRKRKVFIPDFAKEGLERDQDFRPCF